MALTQCSECGHAIAQAAPVCPNCGKLLPVAAHRGRARKIERNIWLTILAVPTLLGLGCGVLYYVGSQEEAATRTPISSYSTPSAEPSTEVDALNQAEAVFAGGYTREQVKARLDQAMQLYGLPITEENYSRAGSALVAMRQQTGNTEMAILDHMIRSHVKGANVSFPDAVGLSSAFLSAGDK